MQYSLIDAQAQNHDFPLGLVSQDAAYSGPGISKPITARSINCMGWGFLQILVSSEFHELVGVRQPPCVKVVERQTAGIVLDQEGDEALVRG